MNPISIKKELNLNLDVFRLKNENDEIVLSHQANDDYSVTIRRPNKEEQQLGHNKNKLFCTGLVGLAPETRIVECFRSLEKHELPSGSKLPEKKDRGLMSEFEKDGSLKPKHVVPHYVLPDDFKAFLVTTSDELFSRIARTVRAYRWMAMIGGNHDPIQSSRGSFWSFDQQVWHHMPSRTGVRGMQQWDYDFSREIIKTVEESVSLSEIDEPIAHSILRDAFHQIDQSPRATLILSMVALEIGIKQLISTLIPDSKWLVENVPSPPVVKMLKTYLPKLPAKNLIEGVVVAPPKKFIKHIDAQMVLRNKSIHIGAEGPEYYELLELLLIIRDCLYLFDYYAGNDWALRRIRFDTQQELKRLALSQLRDGE